MDEFLERCLRRFTEQRRSYVVPLNWSQRDESPATRDDASRLADAYGSATDLRCFTRDERARACKDYHDDWLRLLHGEDSGDFRDRLDRELTMRRVESEAARVPSSPNDAAEEIYADLGPVERLFCRRLYDRLRMEVHSRNISAKR